MHVIVLHKKQLSETETDIDIYVRQYTEPRFFPPPPPRAHSPPFLFSFSVNVAAEALKRDSLY